MLSRASGIAMDRQRDGGMLRAGGPDEGQGRRDEDGALRPDVR